MAKINTTAPETNTPKERIAKSYSDPSVSALPILLLERSLNYRVVG
jgi:hypothetical protein